jgi:glycosyltransferase involved in cell wall biosynthesis
VLISVVIPAYQAALFIEEALDGVAAQQRRADEIIVIDDGSTDATATLVAAWIAAHPQLPTRLVRQPNAGISAARNIGILAAGGDWIALLDADDVWESHHLLALVAAHGHAPQAVAAYGGGQLLVDGVVQPGLYDRYWDNPSETLGQAIAGTRCVVLDRTIVGRLLRGNFIKPSSLLMQRAAALRAGLFHPALRASEDREFLLRLICQGGFVYTPVAITRYRWHADSSTAEKNTVHTMACVLHALHVIAREGASQFDPEHALVLAAELRAATSAYLYTCARGGWRAYGAAVLRVGALGGVRSALAGFRLRHLVHCLSARRYRAG